MVIKNKYIRKFVQDGNDGEVIKHLSQISKVTSSLIFVDLTVSPKAIKAVASKFSYILILDHHTSSKEDYLGEDFPDNVFAYFDLSVCASKIVNQCTMNRKAKVLVNYINDYDMWTKTLPGTEAFIKRFHSNPLTITKWVEVLDKESSVLSLIHTHISMGKVLCHDMENQIEKALKSQWDTDILSDVGLTQIPICFGSSHIIGELSERLIEVNTAKASLVVVPIGRGLIKVRFGSYSGSGFDMSIIAKKYFGGGGHPCASSAVISIDNPLFQTLMGLEGLYVNKNIEFVPSEKPFSKLNFISLKYAEHFYTECLNI